MMPPVVILAGGVATRLRPITEKIPKALLAVAGKPFIVHQLDLLKRNGIDRVVICSGYLSHQIEEYLGDGSKFGFKIQYSVDGDKLLGTGGAVKKALPLLPDEFFVMYGDSYLTADYKAIYGFFRTTTAWGLMTVFKNDNAWDNSNIVFKDGKIVVYDKKLKLEGMDYIDYGLSILRKSAFELIKTKDIFDLSELFKDIIAQNQMAGYVVPERFYEIGKPSGLAETEQYILNSKQEEN